ncbi:uncharacterized protein LOC143353421 [Halictus rubicundus]|uniref:uncharacterized protein LOC143353421 n=1 Tax=Halictus rubicundus TaxID=77578 RepID=UPI004035D508
MTHLPSIVPIVYLSFRSLLRDQLTKMCGASSFEISVRLAPRSSQEKLSKVYHEIHQDSRTPTNSE